MKTDFQGPLLNFSTASYTTRHHYDAAGNPVRTDYPDGSHETFEYDRLNRLTAHIDGLGAKTAYELAVDGLPLKRTNALGHTFAYAYDKARRLTVLTNENGETYRLDYDPTDNLIQETGWDGKITAYGYDAAGQLVQQTEYGQSTDKGRLKDRPETWHIHRFKRNILGQLIEKQSRKVSDRNGQSKDEGISRTRFEYDPITGNLTKARNQHSSVELAYDELDRLIGETTVHNGQSATVGYRLENQLVRAEIKKPAGNTEIWTYAYDPFGRRLSKERQDKLAWTSTEPKRTHFVWDGSHLLQEYTYKGCYTYIYTDQDSYEPLAQVFHNNQDEAQYLAYFHNDQVGIPKEMTDIHGNLLWYGEYTAWGRLKKDERVYKNAHQPFRLQNQYFDEETGLHYNLMRYYEPEAGRFVNQDPIGLLGGENLYQFAPNTQIWIDVWGLTRHIIYQALDLDNPEKIYTGRTRGADNMSVETILANRKRSHHRNLGPMTAVFETSSYRAIRGAEHYFLQDARAKGIATDQIEAITTRWATASAPSCPTAARSITCTTAADTCTKSASTAKSSATSNATNCTEKSKGRRAASAAYTTTTPWVV